VSAIYGWVIDKDHLCDPGAGSGVDESGVQGPRDAPVDILEALAVGEGREFRMLDDDGELYYTGRIIVRGQGDTDRVSGSGWDFAPLDDFGRPNAGAVDIQYRDASGTWQSL
jgi:hypothetical protein